MTTAVSDKLEVTGEYCELPRAQVDQLVRAYKRAKAAQDRAAEKTKAAQQNIIDAMRGCEVLRTEETEQEVVSYRVVTAMVIDTPRLKAEQAEIAARYSKPRTSRPFKVLV